mmetsp:Transcript_23929/g.32914  ORF Transcript_23929/g.32914 Transcript_23929/m.32914 type:complete len:501 (+) Transcript_23929:244-1746(+)
MFRCVDRDEKNYRAHYTYGVNCHSKCLSGSPEHSISFVEASQKILSQSSTSKLSIKRVSKFVNERKLTIRSNFTSNQDVDASPNNSTLQRTNNFSNFSKIPGLASSQNITEDDHFIKSCTSSSLKNVPTNSSRTISHLFQTDFQNPLAFPDFCNLDKQSTSLISTQRKLPNNDSSDFKLDPISAPLQHQFHSGSNPKKFENTVNFSFDSYPCNKSETVRQEHISSSSSDCTMNNDRSHSLPPLKRSKWKLLIQSQDFGLQFETSAELSDKCKKIDIWQERSKSYSVESRQKGMESSVLIQLEQGRTVLLNDIMALRNCFDNTDFHKDWAVIKEDVRAHPRDNFVTKTTFDDILHSLDRELKFDDMLMKAYPKFTKTDVKLCLDALHNMMDESKDFHVNQQVSIRNELEDVEQYWHNYSSKNGVILLAQFQDFLIAMHDERSSQESREMYEMLANPLTRQIHKKEFTMFWINMYRLKPLQWSQVEEEVYQFWAETDGCDIF